MYFELRRYTTAVSAAAEFQHAFQTIRIPFKSVPLLDEQVALVRKKSPSILTRVNVFSYPGHCFSLSLAVQYYRMRLASANGPLRND